MHDTEDVTHFKAETLGPDPTLSGSGLHHLVAL